MKTDVKKIFLLLFPALALILEILPYSGAVAYMTDEGEVTRSYYSYFNPIHIGSGNFALILTGILTAVILIIAVIAFFWGRPGVMKALLVVSLIAFWVSITPLMLGSITALGITISALILLEFIVSVVHVTKS